MDDNGFMEFLENGGLTGEYERHVREAVESAQSDWEREAARRLQAARAEGERAAGMSAEERLREREAALAGREREISRRELRAMAAQTLAGRGLPGDLADALSYEDSDACQRSIDSVEKAFRGAVQAGVAQRLGGGAAPAYGAEPGDAGKLSDDQYYATIAAWRASMD